MFIAIINLSLQSHPEFPNVGYAERKRKLDSLLALLKKQRMVVDVVYMGESVEITARTRPTWARLI